MAIPDPHQQTAEAELQNAQESAGKVAELIEQAEKDLDDLARGVSQDE